MVSAMLLDRSRYRLEFQDDFDGGELDDTKWIPHYLPQWSGQGRSRARYRQTGGLLLLSIDADQPPWSPEHTGAMRVSSLQTAVFSGPAGSEVGQHHFTTGLRVTEAQPERRLYTPHFGIIEARAAALGDPACMVALWLIGFEDEPQRSAEICVFEIFGSEVAREGAFVGMGVHPFGDPRIRDEFAKVPFEGDVTGFHTYSMEWTADAVRFFIDDSLVHSVNQSPDYPMQLMLNIYEFEEDPVASYPKEFAVDWVRGYRLRG